MKRAWRDRLAAAGAAFVCIAVAGQAAAHEAHEEGSATTQAAACKLALALARADASGGRVTRSHCECLEERDNPQAPWSCTGFVSYQ